MSFNFDDVQELEAGSTKIHFFITVWKNVEDILKKDQDSELPEKCAIEEDVGEVLCIVLKNYKIFFGLDILCCNTPYYKILEENFKNSTFSIEHSSSSDENYDFSVSMTCDGEDVVKFGNRHNGFYPNTFQLYDSGGKLLFKTFV